MRDFTVGQQPCQKYTPMIDGNKYATWENVHECYCGHSVGKNCTKLVPTMSDNQCSHATLVKLSGPIYDNPNLPVNPAGKLYVCASQQQDELGLLPCPFCGGHAAIEQVNQSAATLYYVTCSLCESSNTYSATTHEAIDKWNRRTVGGCGAEFRVLPNGPITAATGEK